MGSLDYGLETTLDYGVVYTGLQHGGRLTPRRACRNCHFSSRVGTGPLTARRTIATDWLDTHHP
eukprot:10885208-Lingulodinium_polyedra.AAC.1